MYAVAAAEEALHILTCAELLLIDYTSHGSDSHRYHRRSITSGSRAAAAAINFPADSALYCQHPIAAVAMARLPICARGAYRGD